MTIPKYKRGEFAQLVAEGESFPAAAKALGIHRATVHRWMTAEPEFRERVRQAREEANERQVKAMEARVAAFLQAEADAL